MKKIIFSILLIVIFMPNVFAVCENNEINDWAEKVKVKFVNEEYREKLIFEDGTIIPEYVPKYDYVLSLDPMRDDVYMVVKDSISNKKTTIKNEGSDYYDKVIGSTVHFDEKKYTIEVFVKENAKECAGEKVRTLTYSVPPYNMYTLTTYCEENKDAEICESYKDTSDITEEEFEEITGTGDNKKEENKWVILLKEYWYTILVPFVVISIIYIIKIRKLKREQALKDKFDEEEVEVNNQDIISVDNAKEDSNNDNQTDSKKEDNNEVKK